MIQYHVRINNNPYFSHDKEYFNWLIQQNEPFLSKIPLERIIKYPAQNPDQISSMLTSLCLDLRLDSTVFIVPQGPKTFGLTSILLSVRYPDINLWKLKSKEKKIVSDEGLADGEPIIIKSVFCPEDDLDDY